MTQPSVLPTLALPVLLLLRSMLAQVLSTASSRTDTVISTRMHRERVQPPSCQPPYYYPRHQRHAAWSRAPALLRTPPMTACPPNKPALSHRVRVTTPSSQSNATAIRDRRRHHRRGGHRSPRKRRRRRRFRPRTQLRRQRRSPLLLTLALTNTTITLGRRRGITYRCCCCCCCCSWRRHPR